MCKNDIKTNDQDHEGGITRSVQGKTKRNEGNISFRTCEQKLRLGVFFQGSELLKNENERTTQS